MRFSELNITSNFTFLKGGSSPEEYAQLAALIGLKSIAIADENSVAGIVRAYSELKEIAHQVSKRKKIDHKYGKIGPILKSPTIGYIIGFFIAAQIIGNMSQKPTIGIATGTFAIYTCGVIGLMITLNMSPIEAIGIGVYPFIIGDLIKASLALSLIHI